MKLKAEDYASRKELEQELAKVAELTPVRKTHTIEGSAKDMKRLGLSERTTFYGCTCIVNDSPPKERTARQAVDRGERTDYGINGKTKKI